MSIQPTLSINFFEKLRILQNQQPIPFTGLPRTLGLLAYLLLHQDTSISRTQLAFILWPDETEVTARANLRRHLYNLRQVLPLASDGQPWFINDSQHLRWNTQADFRFDVTTFTSLLDAGHMKDACDLYTGDLLPELSDDWLRIEREQLHIRFIEAIETLADCAREAGDLQAAIRYTQRLLTLDPLNETAAHQLMSLYVSVGQRNTALRIYDTFAARMRNELGVDPLPEILALRTRIAQREKIPATLPPPAPILPSSLPLPRPAHPLIGRTREQAAIVQLIGLPAAPARMLTLTGPGGVGKTRFAINIAAALIRDFPATFPNGAHFVALTDVHDATLLLPRIAAGMGLNETDARPARERLEAALREQHVLLVLDNCEHLLEAAPVIEQLLGAAPGLRILATSREPLGVYGEHRVLIPPLALPNLAALPPIADLAQYESVALFVERAQAAAGEFRLDAANAIDVAAICVALDGLPLAIELAAAQCAVLTPAAVRTLMIGRLDMLTNPARTAPVRHQNLRATFDWSYRLLERDEQRALARLGIFAGGWTTRAAAHMLADDTGVAQVGRISMNAEAATLQLLIALARKSLVVAIPATDIPRFMMLETIREYVLEQLPRDENERARRRHASYYFAVAEASSQIQGQDHKRWADSLEQDHDNLRAALDWSIHAEPGIALGIAAALWPFWSAHGHLREGRRYLELALEAIQGDPNRLRAAALYGIGNLAWLQADYQRAYQVLEECLALQRKLDDQAGLAATLHRLGAVAGYQGDFAQATARYEESMAIKRRLGDVVGIANTLNNLAITAQEQGHLEQAANLYAEALKIYRQHEHERGVAIALNNLGDLAMLQGNSDSAAKLYRESLTIRRSIGEREGLTYGLRGLAAVAGAQGRPLEAARIWGAEEALRERLGTAVPLSDRPTYERQITTAHAAAQPDAFAAAWATGRTLNLDRILVELIGAPVS